MSKPKFTEEQLKFIKHSGRESVILSAVAGSGKTASATGRLLWLLNNGVKPEKIIYFSFTNDAVDELRARINNDDIKVTTIHSFCASVLGTFQKYKPLVESAMFPNWFKKKYKPKKRAKKEEIIFYQKACKKLDDNYENVLSEISKYKLSVAEGKPLHQPSFFKHYQRFLIETRTRDFADMLIDTLHLTSNRRWEKLFEYKYDYVFVDEYQDTSVLQMKILLALRAKMYHLIGDRNQSIYQFQGANYIGIENELKEHKNVIEYSLTKNFRSAKNIVEYANYYSQLEAIPFHEDIPGLVDKEFLNESQFYKLLKEDKDGVVVLARTNAVIRNIEFNCLQRKINIDYRNIGGEEVIEALKRGGARNGKVSTRVKQVLNAFGGTPSQLLKFLDKNKNSKSFVTSIHKSKGREYPNCIIVNSVSPELLEKNRIVLSDKEQERFSFEYTEKFEEHINLHYVASTRPKEKLYFALIDEESHKVINPKFRQLSAKEYAKLKRL